VVTDAPGPDLDNAIDTIVQADGKTLVLANSSSFGGATQFVSRFNSDGSRDTSFGDDGFYRYSLNHLSGSSLALQPDGNILLTGRPTARLACCDEWTSANSYAIRVANLRSGTGLNGGYVLRVAGDAGTGTTTVFDDDSVDNLRGQAGLDWFFANVLEDIVLDRNASSEFLSDLE
jgi:hypothetical protein